MGGVEKGDTSSFPERAGEEKMGEKEQDSSKGLKRRTETPTFLVGPKVLRKKRRGMQIRGGQGGGAHPVQRKGMQRKTKMVDDSMQQQMSESCSEKKGVITMKNSWRRNNCGGKREVICENRGKFRVKKEKKSEPY